MISRLYENRLREIEKDFKYKLNKLINDSNTSDYYMQKLKIIHVEMTEIRDDENFTVEKKSELILDKTKMFEDYADKYQQLNLDIEELKKQHTNEIELIRYMIKQSHPHLTDEDINEHLIKYININEG